MSAGGPVGDVAVGPASPTVADDFHAAALRGPFAVSVGALVAVVAARYGVDVEAVELIAIDDVGPGVETSAHVRAVLAVDGPAPVERNEWVWFLPPTT